MDKLRLLELLKDVAVWVDDENYLKLRVEAEIKAIKKTMEKPPCRSSLPG